MGSSLDAVAAMLIYSTLIAASIAVLQSTLKNEAIGDKPSEGGARRRLREYTTLWGHKNGAPSPCGCQQIVRFYSASWGAIYEIARRGEANEIENKKN